MESNRIHSLLEKYWNCETSASEEKELQDYFLGDNVPPDLQRYIPVFGYRETQQSLTLGADFDERLKTAMDNAEVVEKNYVTIKIFRPLLRIAASVLLIAGLGVSLFFIAKQNNKPRFAETYNDPDAALKHATFALEKLSDALQMGENASLRTLQNIDEMDIDWSALDSLSAPVSVSAETEETLKTEENL
ncbi:MAG: hypothetical protein LBR13_07320 [Dysgonamonadaceae bacterium]|jgi:hypothetical protein|nr:hypothetical protein [Dysgonamonadaceae bacterium]